MSSITVDVRTYVRLIFFRIEDRPRRLVIEILRPVALLQQAFQSIREGSVVSDNLSEVFLSGHNGLSSA
ncbi:hypothetical protein ASF82_08740 [Frigoribacterium sp. Leaf164]|nr:hypothetical protein ASF82_08740 [Frigoribacterium sp. Leaf164]